MLLNRDHIWQRAMKSRFVWKHLFYYERSFSTILTRTNSSIKTDLSYLWAFFQHLRAYDEIWIIQRLWKKNSIKMHGKESSLSSLQFDHVKTLCLGVFNTWFISQLSANYVNITIYFIDMCKICDEPAYKMIYDCRLDIQYVNALILTKSTFNFPKIKHMKHCFWGWFKEEWNWK